MKVTPEQANTIVLTKDELALANAALPRSYEDLGSERQVTASNRWYAFLKKQLSPEAMLDFEDWALGATDEEAIHYSIGLLANANRKEEQADTFESIVKGQTIVDIKFHQHECLRFKPTPILVLENGDEIWCRGKVRVIDESGHETTLQEDK